MLAALAGRIYDHAPQQNAFPLGLRKNDVAPSRDINQTALMATRPVPVHELTTDERIELIGRLWDSLDAQAAAPTTDALRQELAQREAAADEEPDAGDSWESLRDRLAKRAG